MKSRTLQVLVAWNAVLTVLLIVALGSNALLAQAANDPPVKVYSAATDHNGTTNGASTIGDKLIDSNVSWTQLLSVTVNFTGQSHTHQCAVIASSEALNGASGTTDNLYAFDLTVDSPAGDLNAGSTRTIDFDDNATTDDTNYLEVSSNRLFTNLSAGAHTFRWLGMKQAANDDNMIVNDSSMVVLCFKKLQTALALPQDAPLSEPPPVDSPQ